jgi:hypothetical protein
VAGHELSRSSAGVDLRRYSWFVRLFGQAEAIIEQLQRLRYTTQDASSQSRGAIGHGGGCWVSVLDLHSQPQRRVQGLFWVGFSFFDESVGLGTLTRYCDGHGPLSRGRAPLQDNPASALSRWRCAFVAEDEAHRSGRDVLEAEDSSAARLRSAVWVRRVLEQDSDNACRYELSDEPPRFLLELQLHQFARACRERERRHIPRAAHACQRWCGLRGVFEVGELVIER